MHILLISILFVLGYVAIACERPLKINKAASALLTGVLVWTVYVFFSADKEIVARQLTDHFGSLSGILFFLMGAMTIVQLIDAHDGFAVITSRINTSSKRKLLWIISLLTFCLSAVLDNLTTAIVMASIVRNLLAESRDRMLFLGMIVIAANAGGAWSPIGDVTTTMLWISGQITSANIILKLLVPSLVCLLTPLVALSILIKGTVTRPSGETSALRTRGWERNFAFLSGLAVLLFVPLFKTFTHLPPYIGILFGLGILWVITERIHHEKEKEEKSLLSVAQALRNIDVPSILFFLGILLAISALESTHLLSGLARLMDERIGNQSLIIICIGLLSAVVDNVPLVAATIGMYGNVYPADSYLWEFIAYCAGTGGSILIIGSAAGVGIMGIEKIDFLWYLRKIGWLAALGYFAGAGAYVLQEYLLRN